MLHVGVASHLQRLDSLHTCNPSTNQAAVQTLILSARGRFSPLSFLSLLLVNLLFVSSSSVTFLHLLMFTVLCAAYIHPTSPLLLRPPCTTLPLLISSHLQSAAFTIYCILNHLKPSPPCLCQLLTSALNQQSCDTKCLRGLCFFCTFNQSAMTVELQQLTDLNYNQ